MISTKIGNRIKEIRKKLNITGNEMAKKLEISVQNYSQLESGYLKITVDQFITISIMLGVTPQSLILAAKDPTFKFFEDKKRGKKASEIIVIRKKKVI